MLNFHSQKKRLKCTNIETEVSEPLTKKKREQLCMNPTSSSNTTSSKLLSNLQKKMASKLTSARFRQLNEELYTKSGEEMFLKLKTTPKLFEEYHRGYEIQVQSWKKNPTLLIIDWIRHKVPKSYIIADLGCGAAHIAKTFPKRKVLSYDLVAVNPDFVTAANIADIPLEDESVHIAIFCLSLMGSDWPMFLKEASRILKPNGILKIAEVQSRFIDIKKFIEAIEHLGFRCCREEDIGTYFSILEFIKTTPKLMKSHSLITLPNSTLLSPCVYKKR